MEKRQRFFFAMFSTSESYCVVRYERCCKAKEGCHGLEWWIGSRNNRKLTPWKLTSLSPCLALPCLALLLLLRCPMQVASVGGWQGVHKYTPVYMQVDHQPYLLSNTVAGMPCTNSAWVWSGVEWSEFGLWRPHLSASFPIPKTSHINFVILSMSALLLQLVAKLDVFGRIQYTPRAWIADHVDREFVVEPDHLRP
jgi:hypothetical protein